jgi:hypothetical protein
MEHRQLAETAAQVECHSRLVAVVIHLCQKSKTLRSSAASIQAQTKAHSYEVAVPDMLTPPPVWPTATAKAGDRTRPASTEAITAKVRRDRETSQPFQARLESFQRSIGMLASKDNIAFRVRGQYSDECGSTGAFAFQFEIVAGSQPHRIRSNGNNGAVDICLK